METPGNLFVVAAPSGAGKSSLVKALLELDSHLAVSVSHTTRPPRGQEQDGREYWFIGEPEFRAMIDRGEFFEWAQVHGNLYGTSRKAIEARLQHGEDVVLEIDWQGALQIKQLFPHAVLIFILPPSWDELLQRLHRRGDLPCAHAEPGTRAEDRVEEQARRDRAARDRRRRGGCRDAAPGAALTVCPGHGLPWPPPGGVQSRLGSGPAPGLRAFPSPLMTGAAAPVVLWQERFGHSLLNCV